MNFFSSIWFSFKNGQAYTLLIWWVHKICWWAQIYKKNQKTAVCWLWLALKMCRWWLLPKLRRLGLPNQIVNNLDSKPSKFERQIWSDSKSDNEILLYRFLFDEYQSKSRFKDRKWSILIEKVKINWKSQCILTFFIKIDRFQNLRLNPETIYIIDFVATINLDSKNSDQNFDWNLIQLQIFSIKKLKMITSPKLTALFADGFEINWHG